MLSGNQQTQVVIITALEIEATAVIRHLGEVETVRDKRRTFYCGELCKNGNEIEVVVISLSQMGNVEAAVATTQAIDVWNPEYIIMTGIAGGVKKGSERQLGDVVVAEQIVGYEPSRITDGVVTQRFDVFRPALDLISTAKKLKTESWALSTHVGRPDGKTGRVIPNVHFGIVASGEKVVADDDFVDDLQTSWSRLAAVEMEGYGTALAAYESQSAPGMLLVKSICDWADSSKNDDWQEYAADVAAAYTIALIHEAPFKFILDYLTKPQPKRKKEKKYSHKSKIGLCKRLGDEWHDLADYFNIPLNHRDRFQRGRECQGIWDWLDRRNKLGGIEDALEGIDRDDLIDELILEAV